MKYAPTFIFSSCNILQLRPLNIRDERKSVTKSKSIDMKKICFAVLLLFFCNSISAQKPHSELRHELGINAGPISFAGSFFYGTIGFFTALGGSIGHQAVDMNLYGHYNLHYYYQVAPWCQVGVKGSTECAKITRFSDTLRTSVTSIDRYAIITLMPSVRFTYLNRPWVRLYSGLDLGCGYLASDSRSGKSSESDDSAGSNFLFAFNVTAFGVNVGKGFYGLFELNAGFDSFVKVGIGARF